jgi:S-adenosylmethionine:tRNA ribosyltransferase-isomerase
VEVPDAIDRERYQTVYAHERGSVAAPTAGLHLTPRVLTELDAMGIERAAVVLHVGVGTFKPVETEFVEEHPIHSEWCSMSPGTKHAIRAAKRDGRRVICVGTTAARTVESFAALDGAGDDAPSTLDTRLLITPGYRWLWTDGLLTNFHLPRSTLLAMCGAMLDGGVERLKGLYAEALGSGYRFFSYGDAMLIGDP